MDPRTLAYIAEACGAGLLAGNPAAQVLRVCTDSRQVQPGDLFIALKGERFDAHDFLPEVAAKSPTAMLVQQGRWTAAGECAVIETAEDTRVALARFAARYRQDFDLPVIAVAGSNGKTTTKELLHSVLKRKAPAHCSAASFNNDIGVPLSLLNLERPHWAAVFEVGTNHPGELSPLLRMVDPRYSVITSIGREHMEHFGTLQEVSREEGTAAEVLPKEGKLFINGDAPLVDEIVSRTRAGVIRVGTNPQCQWRVDRVKTGLNGTTFNLDADAVEFKGSYRVPLFGNHQAVNAALAIALGAELGLSRDQVQQGLAECAPPKMRMQLWETQGAIVLDDAYNANTDSMLAALKTLQAFPCHGRRLAVLGDMAEQGAQSEAAHHEVGQAAAQFGVDQLFTVGSMAAHIARGARQAGLHRVLEFEKPEGAGPAVRSFVRTGDVLLIKASRVMQLEKISGMLRPSDAQKKT